LKRAWDDLGEERGSGSFGKNPNVSIICNAELETGLSDVRSSDEADTQASKRQWVSPGVLQNVADSKDHLVTLVAPPAANGPHR